MCACLVLAISPALRGGEWGGVWGGGFTVAVTSLEEMQVYWYM